MNGTQSQGITLLLWFLGGLYALAAASLYSVAGLCMPRMNVDGVELGVPRSGGELNYVCLDKLNIFKLNPLTVR